MPRIHVYGFSVDADPIQDLIKRIALIMQCDSKLIVIESCDRGNLRDSKKRKRNIQQESNLLDADVEAENNQVDNEKVNSDEVVELPKSGAVGHIVRDVAPLKVMVCLSFYLPLQVCVVLMSFCILLNFSKLYCCIILRLKVAMSEPVVFPVVER